MIDLPALGRDLRARRKALRLPSAELARRIGVSPTYVWLIEQAKPRSNGEPSRPSEDVLSSWTAVLGLDEEEAQRLRELAGYFGPPPSPSLFSIPEPPHSHQSDRRAGSLSMRTRSSTPADESFLGTAAPLAGMPAERDGQAPAEETEDELIRRLQQVLHIAEATGRWDEAAVLMRSFLRWLRFHVEDGEDADSGSG